MSEFIKDLLHLIGIGEGNPYRGKDNCKFERDTTYEKPFCQIPGHDETRFRPRFRNHTYPFCYDGNCLDWEEAEVEPFREDQACQGFSCGSAPLGCSDPRYCPERGS